MIISCNNCYKKFNINSDLIPEKGRLLQCSGCDYKWFFQKESNISEINKTELNDEKKIDKSKTPKKIIQEKKSNSIPKDTEKFIIQAETALKKKEKVLKKNKFPSLAIVFLISFVALIILIDTFKYPISKIIPNIEFILYNLYETIKDIKLFFKDLI